MTREKEDQERLLVGGTVDFKLQAWTPLAAAGGWLEGRQLQDPLLARRRRPTSLPLIFPSAFSVILLPKFCSEIQLHGVGFAVCF